MYLVLLCLIGIIGILEILNLDVKRCTFVWKTTFEREKLQTIRRGAIPIGCDIIFVV